MYCRFCGKDLNNRVRYCPACGNAQDMAQPLREKSTVDAPAVSMTGYAPQRAADIRIRKTRVFWTGKLMILFSLLCFMMPFFRTSVNLVSTHSKHYSGTYLLFEAKEEADSEYIPKSENKVYVVFNDISYIIGAAALLALTALLTPKLPWFFAGASAFALLMMCFLSQRAEQRLAKKPYGINVDIDIEYGLVIAAGLLIFSAVIMAADEWKQKKKQIFPSERKPDVTNT